MHSVPFSRDELRAKMAEQISFLTASCRAYDEGNQAEALRMAVSIRVLVHQTASSHSLIHQLGIAGAIPWPNTGRPLPPHVTYSDDGSSKTTRPGVFLRLCRLSMGAGATKFVPKLDEVAGAATTGFDAWWTAPILRSPGDPPLGPPRELTRRDVVLGLANKEGGAHVDPSPTFQWWVATRAGGYGRISTSPEGTPQWEVSMGKLAKATEADGEIVTPVYASMRTIAAEALHALATA